MSPCLNILWDKQKGAVELRNRHTILLVLSIDMLQAIPKLTNEFFFADRLILMSDSKISAGFYAKSTKLIHYNLQPSNLFNG